LSGRIEKAIYLTEEDMCGSTPIILGKSDFGILKRYIAQMREDKSIDCTNLLCELHAAIVVDDEILPENCIRLNSTIKVREWPSDKILEFSIVAPESANRDKKWVSFLDPWGAAFIGLSKTEKVEREINGISKCFKILDVKHLSN
jgi:regulator of nucleoside diphosphate kinase